ncbi:hypothetical protein DFP73DRAFT_551883 [Morchella snyderi]|nr:hypothetical protein DFP73DRAFT_551883 [Morchella snyderi]
MTENSAPTANSGAGGNDREEHPKMILYHYPFSPYAHKISWYLNLRGIKYQECIQPPILPRQDLAILGITYRRIPLLAIGNDVYIDTTLILRELERRFPDGGLDTDPQRSLEYGKRSNGMFPFAAGCIPSSLPIMNDERFIKDRSQFSGRSWKKEDIDAARPKALAGVRKAFEAVEKDLSDGRDWILGNELSLADIEVAWPLEWVISMPGALLNSDITPETFPKTFAHITRLKARIPDSKAAGVTKIKGEEAKAVILSYHTQQEETGNVGVTDDDPSGVTWGEEVEITPVDTGRANPQRGRVRELSKEKVVIEVVPTGEYHGKGRKALRVHFPRERYEVVSRSAKGGAKL